MTATDFDPEAIASRVIDREQQQPTPVAPTSPLARVQGSCVTGTGEAHGLPVPTEAIRPLVDLETRIEQGRQRRAVQSPFGPPDQRPAPKPLTRRERAALLADEERFAAPDIDEDPPMKTPAPQPSTTDSGTATGLEPAGEQDHHPDCGQPVTGGGAPRGWILIRIIGQGQPRRYCAPACARAALVAKPDLQNLQKVVAPTPAGTARPRSPGVATKERLARLMAIGATAQDVRLWAANNGLPCGDRGIPAKTVIDGYLAAHPAARP